MENKPILIKSGEAMAMLGVDKRALAALEEAGLIRSVRPGKVRYWIRTTIESVGKSLDKDLERE
jgi:DNA-binding transcriptional MerR regulator